jgi:hypothetical protein
MSGGLKLDDITGRGHEAPGCSLCRFLMFTFLIPTLATGTSRTRRIKLNRPSGRGLMSCGHGTSPTQTPTSGPSSRVSRMRGFGRCTLPSFFSMLARKSNRARSCTKQSAAQVLISVSRRAGEKSGLRRSLRIGASLTTLTVYLIFLRPARKGAADHERPS